MRHGKDASGGGEVVTVCTENQVKGVFSKDKDNFEIVWWTENKTFSRTFLIDFRDFL